MTTLDVVQIGAAEVDAAEMWASDRRKAALAARLMACCLGIPAQPGFDLSGEQRGGYTRTRPYVMGESTFKDAWDASDGEECGHFQVLVVDEHGNILAESKQTYALGHALDLLGRLPLGVSPHADDWLKDALGRRGPMTARPAPEAAGPLDALGNKASELMKGLMA